MATKRKLTKEEKISKEIKKLAKIFSGIDGNKRQTVEHLIEMAAFMAISLAEYQDIINAEGYTEEYQNGKNQYGRKQSEAVKSHIAMMKNYSAVIKQLLEMVPPEQKKESRLASLQRE